MASSARRRRGVGGPGAATENWERLVRAALKRDRAGGAGASAAHAGAGAGLASAVPPSLGRTTNIEQILQAADDIEDEDPNVARILCEQAYSMAQNLDPSSDGRGVLQFKTGLASVIKQKLAKKDGGSIDRQKDIEVLWKFYLEYKKHRRVDDMQREQEIMRESGTYSTEMGARAMEMKKIYATLRALLDVLEILVGQAPSDRLGKQILDEIKKIKRSDAALRGELMPYNIIPLDTSSVGNVVGFFPEVRAAIAAIQNCEDLPHFPYDTPQLRQKDIFDLLQYVFGFQDDNVRNQRENVALTLANAQSRLSLPNETEPVQEVSPQERKQMGSTLIKMTLKQLKYITSNFSHELGRGTFGVVYKGMLKNGQTVAVKKLVQTVPTSKDQFENEVNLLLGLKHPNIVRLLGYCYEMQHSHMPHQGKFVFAWNVESLLCLEYLTNGSLDRYISDASSGLDWPTRCKIIEGISYGLQYLHEQPNDPIIHLDLKPANILLDENMVPKIADFGLSRLFDKKQTIYTKFATGTLGYMPPEYLRGIITPMWDIFSFGVIIMEVITGHREYPYEYDNRTSSQGFIKLELQKWRIVLQKEPGYTLLEADCEQIKRFLKIGLICVNPDRTKRPAMSEIIDMLQGLEI